MQEKVGSAAYRLLS